MRRTVAAVAAIAIAMVLVPPASADPKGRSSVKFLMTQSDGAAPVRFNPCLPLTYVVSSRGLSAEHHSRVQIAMEEVSRLMGVTWKELPPIAWTPSNTTLFAGNTASDADLVFGFVPKGRLWGLRGSTGIEGQKWAGTRSWKWLTGSYAFFDLSKFSRLDVLGQRGALFHSIGHAVGLAHVKSPSEVMHPNAFTKRVVIGSPLYVQGLREVGAAAGCGGVPAPPAAVSIDSTEGIVLWQDSPSEGTSGPGQVSSYNVTVRGANGSTTESVWPDAPYLSLGGAVEECGIEYAVSVEVTAVSRGEQVSAPATASATVNVPC
jgi:hypothetical protein